MINNVGKNNVSIFLFSNETIKNYNSKKNLFRMSWNKLNSKKKPNLVDEIRKDIKIIWKFISSRLNFTGRDKEKMIKS